jgi:hypothetical protein
MTGTLNLASGGVPTAGAGIGLELTGRTLSSVRTAGYGNMVLNRSSVANAAGQGFVQFTLNDVTPTQIGSINVASGTSVVYNTTSDPRTKTPPPETRGIGDAAARAQQLGRLAWQGEHVDPATGEPAGDGPWDFVSSHDIEDVAPYAVYGDRDAVDEQGAPVWQQVSYGDLVPLLFAALAQALDRIDALEATP